MVPMELTASLYAVETVRIITLVTGETELALVVLLDGKINIVTKVRKNYVKCVFLVVKYFLASN